MAKKPAVKKPVDRSVESLKTLLAQVNKLAPKRSKASDGWIGDQAHMSRHSDHNPEPDGTVDARDFTNDPSGGCDARKLAQAILDSRDPRLSYVISNGEIAHGRLGAKGKKPWTWYKYTGANGHFHHCHVSVLDEGQDDTTPWKVEATFKKSPAAVIRPAEALTPKQVNSVMHLGSKGDYVKTLQTNLNALGYGPLEVTGIFEKDTEFVVKQFQTDMHLDLVDGWAGPDTVGAIGKELAKAKLKPKVAEAEAKVVVAEEKVAAAEKVVNDAAGNGRRFSITEWVAAALGLSAGGTSIKQVADNVAETTNSLGNLILTIGLPVLLGVVVVGGAGYLIYERRNKRLEALAVKKVL